MPTVLVVDDDMDLRTIIRRILQDKGYRVVEAADGLQALRMFRSERPDLVISDIIMPDCDGIEAIVAMKERSPSTKILAMSGGGRAKAMELLELAPRAGADGTMTKPFRQSELLKRVDDLIGGRQL